MAWDVRLQDENGKPVVPKDAGVEPKLIPLDGQYRLLHYIDPYGDTYFNRLQMSDFLLDWDSSTLILGKPTSGCSFGKWPCDAKMRRTYICASSAIDALEKADCITHPWADWVM